MDGQDDVAQSGLLRGPDTPSRDRVEGLTGASAPDAAIPMSRFPLPFRLLAGATAPPGWTSSSSRPPSVIARVGIATGPGGGTALDTMDGIEQDGEDDSGGGNIGRSSGPTREKGNGGPGRYRPREPVPLISPTAARPTLPRVERIRGDPAHPPGPYPVPTTLAGWRSPTRPPRSRPVWLADS
jgi:hypothetical protein